MITYTRQSKFDVYAYTKTDELCVARYEMASRRLMCINHSNEDDDITKNEFLAFVREHHDADTVAFVEKWIEKREPKGEHFQIQAVPMRIRRDGTFQINARQGDWWDFGTDGQRELVAKLTENLRRHGEEVGT